MTTFTAPSRQFVRAASALAHAGGYNDAAAAYARRWTDTPDVAAWLERATVAAMDADSSDGLVLPGTTEILNQVRPRTLIGRIGRLRRVPFHRGAAIASGGVSFAWVGEGAPLPVGRLAWSRASLPVAKAGGIVVLTDELMKLSSPGAESVTREEIVRGLAAFLDSVFIDPDVVAVADESPGSITNGVTAIASTGTTADAALADLRALIQATLDDLETLDGVVLMMSDATAFALATMTTAGGSPAFPGLGVTGGTLYGIPTLASSAVGGQIVSLHAPSMMLADDGRMAVDASIHASIAMDDAPTVDSVTPTATNLVSLWQANAAALRITRWINWEAARADAVHVVSGVAYGADGS